MANACDLNIREMAKKFSVSLRTLRFYESKGLLAPNRIGMSRFYSVKDQIKLELIIKGKRFGFSLAELAELVVSGSEASLTVLPLTLKQIENRIESLSQRREEIDRSIGELQIGLARKKA